ncbi:MAG: helix-turn-helix transcriptional regulator [Okeania sp. SIO3B3]|nr:helix-turn-helix transcriptional regulator [Okeania sp. SIO3B3]
MDIAKRIKQLRQEKGWTQAQLGEKLGIHQMHVSSCERGVYKPSAELLIKLAKTFDVSLDYLVYKEDNILNNKIDIRDRELLKQFEKIDKLSEKDRNLIKQILEMAIVKNEVLEKLAAI